MAGQRVKVDSAFYQKTLSTAARDTYETQVRQLGALGAIVDSDVTDTRVVSLGYYHSAPMPVLQRRGDPIREASFDSTSYEGRVRKFSVEVPWDTDDAADDQLGGLEPRARDTGKRFGLIDIKTIELYLRGAVDPAVLDVLDLSPDGVGMFSALDGAGDPRFGVTGGNIVTGSGVASQDDIETDIYAAMVRFASMLDTEGEQLHPDGVDGSGYTLLVPVALRRVFEKAFKMDAVANDNDATTSNILIQNGVKYVIKFLSPDVTGNSWWIAANASTVKPLTILDRGAMRTVPFDETNDRQAWQTDVAGVAFKLRRGHVPNLPYGIIQVSN